MTFYQARAISKTGLHVRRSSWPADQWFMIWRGTWFCFAGGNPPRPVRATDYSADDLLATDWTTVPAALAACPIDPTIGSTGGGDPTPGTDGSPDDPTPPFSGGPGITPPGSPTTLPPPDPGTGITVTFDSILAADSPPGFLVNVNLNRPVTLPALGGTTTFLSGWLPSLGQTSDTIQWQVSATRFGSDWHVELTAISIPTPSGGFISAAVQPAGHAADNIYTTSSDAFYAGHAIVGAG